MFGRVTHTLDAALRRVRSFVYVIHILYHHHQLFFDTEREYTLFNYQCFIDRVLAAIYLYYYQTFRTSTPNLNNPFYNYSDDTAVISSSIHLLFLNLDPLQNSAIVTSHCVQ